jgi:hypothetical protein
VRRKGVFWFRVIPGIVRKKAFLDVLAQKQSESKIDLM